jgi:hypothetical protein
MRIWKLSPTNLRDPIWRTWNPEPMIVRAESQSEARHLAVLKTVKYLPAIPGAPIKNPWAGLRKVEDSAPAPTVCEDITEQSVKYPAEGPAAVLEFGRER